MSIVSAYTDLSKGDKVPLHSFSRCAEGRLNSSGSEGLDVTWEDSFPEDASVYIEWTPRVFAVWEEPMEDPRGIEIEQPGPGPVPEPDLSAGEGGERVDDVPTSAAPGSEAVE